MRAVTPQRSLLGSSCAALAMLLACGCTDRGSVEGVLDLSHSTITLSTHQLVANGASLAQVNVVLRDAYGSPLQGVHAALSTTGTAAIVTQPQDVSDAGGHVTGYVAGVSAGSTIITAWVHVADVTAAVPQTAQLAFVLDDDGNAGSDNGNDTNPNNGDPVKHVTVQNMPANAVRGTLYTVTVILTDAHGNLVTHSTDHVHFTSTDANAALPSDTQFTMSDNGVATFQVGFFTNGTQRLMCTDVDTGAVGQVFPITVTGYSAVAVSTGEGALSTCALFTNNQAKCWGFNPNGNLGYGDIMNRGFSTAQMGSNLPFINVGAGRSVLQVSAGGDAFSGGGDMACAVLDDHSTRCWGYNGYGNLGYNDTTQRTSPSATAINLGAGRTAQSLAVGGTHVCALLDTNQVTCWGNNAAGQLGTGNFTNLSAPPAPINLGAGRTAVKVAAGYTFSCAILDNGTLSCWGNNAFGQLGQGNTNDLASPTGVALSGHTVTDVSLGSNHTCVLLDNNQVSCWGYNRDGQLGLGDTNDRHAPAGTMALNGHNATAVNAENDGSCVILDNGQVTCVGYNAQGQLGLGDTVNRNAPLAGTPVSFGSGRTVLDVTGGMHFACAVLDTAQVSCWGGNPNGELGLGDTMNRGDQASTTPDQYAPLQLW